VLPVPVTGLTEAALASAHLLGHRISIIAISQRIQAWYREVVDSYGFGSRLASIRALDRPLAVHRRRAEEHAQALQALAERAVSRGRRRSDHPGRRAARRPGALAAWASAAGAGGRDGVSSAVRHAETCWSAR
jgi:allantoin racemase